MLGSHRHREAASHYGMRLSLLLALRDVLLLQALARGDVNVEKKYGSLGEDDPCPLRSGLWSCQTEFMSM